MVWGCMKGIKFGEDIFCGGIRIDNLSLSMVVPSYSTKEWENCRGKNFINSLNLIT